MYLLEYTFVSSFYCYLGIIESVTEIEEHYFIMSKCNIHRLIPKSRIFWSSALPVHLFTVLEGHGVILT